MNVKEALHVLETAAANDVDDVKQIFSSEYKNLKNYECDFHGMNLKKNELVAYG